MRKLSKVYLIPMIAVILVAAVFIGIWVRGRINESHWSTEYMKTLSESQDVYFYVSYSGEAPRLRLYSGDTQLKNEDALGSELIDNGDGSYSAYIYYQDVPAGDLQYGYDTTQNADFNVVPVTWYTSPDDENLRSLDYGGYTDIVDVVKLGTQFLLQD